MFNACKTLENMNSSIMRADQWLSGDQSGVAGEITKGCKEAPLDDRYDHYLDCGDGCIYMSEVLKL